ESGTGDGVASKIAIRSQHRCRKIRYFQDPLQVVLAAPSGQLHARSRRVGTILCGSIVCVVIAARERPEVGHSVRSTGLKNREAGQLPTTCDAVGPRLVVFE